MDEDEPQPLTHPSRRAAPIELLWNTAWLVQASCHRTARYLPSWRTHTWDRSPGWPGSTTTGQKSAPVHPVFYTSESDSFTRRLTLYSITQYVKLITGESV